MDQVVTCAPLYHVVTGVASQDIRTAGTNDGVVTGPDNLIQRVTISGAEVICTVLQRRQELVSDGGIIRVEAGCNINGILEVCDNCRISLADAQGILRG